MKTFQSIYLGLALCLPLPAFAGSPDLSGIRAVETDSTDIFAVLTTLQTAQTALENRDYEAARRGFEFVLLHDSSLPTARAGIRRTLIATGDMETAAKWVDDDTSVDALIIQVLLGNIDTPQTHLTARLKTDSDPRLWTLLGHIQDKAGQHDLARQSYAMAGLAGGRAGLSENNIGQSHLVAGEIDAALESFTAAAKADPDDLQFDNNRRRALIASGRMEEAVTGLQAERASTFLAEAGHHAAASGDVNLATFLYRKSLNLSPRHNPEVALKLAQLNPEK